MNITSAQIKSIVAPNGKQSLVDGFATYLNKYGPQYGVNTYLRVCHFIAQCAEESAHFNTLHEYASGAEYQGRLGNVNPGDGVRYKGAGYIELTGRYNYTEASKRLGIDLVNHPELALEPEVGMLVSLDYWKTHNINALADADNVLAVTHAVNGGTNGLAVREAYLAKAKSVFKGVDFSTPPVAPPVVVIPPVVDKPVVVTPTPITPIPVTVPPVVEKPVVPVVIKPINSNNMFFRILDAIWNFIKRGGK